MNNWFQLLESGREVGAVFFNFRKAFDLVLHYSRLRKLEDINLHPLATLKMDPQLCPNNCGKSVEQYPILYLSIRGFHRTQWQAHFCFSYIDGIKINLCCCPKIVILPFLQRTHFSTDQFLAKVMLQQDVDMISDRVNCNYWFAIQCVEMQD